MNDQAKITFMLEDGKEESFEVLEKTKINGINYLLIASEEDEALRQPAENQTVESAVVPETARKGKNLSAFSSG